jgi:hypothetical protein
VPQQVRASLAGKSATFLLVSATAKVGKLQTIAIAPLYLSPLLPSCVSSDQRSAERKAHLRRMASFWYGLLAYFLTAEPTSRLVGFSTRSVCPALSLSCSRKPTASAE